MQLIHSLCICGNNYNVYEYDSYTIYSHLVGHELQVYYLRSYHIYLLVFL
nr:MAG TPA: hypothetical protein [Caudoviricetes sp.]